MMKNEESERPRKGRRFREKEDGPVIRRWYAVMPTAELAERMGLTVRQITNYVYRWNSEPEECIGTVGREQQERAQRGSAVEKTSKIKSEYFFCKADFSLLCKRKPVLREIWKYTLTELEVYYDGAGSILLRKWGY